MMRARLRILRAAVDDRVAPTCGSPRSRRSACGSPRSRASISARLAASSASCSTRAQRQRLGQQQAGAQPHVGGRVVVVPDARRCRGPSAAARAARPAPSRRVHEQAHRRRAVAARHVGLVERGLQRVGAAGLGLDHDAGAGAGRVGAERDDEVARLAARDHARGVAHRIEHVAGGQAHAARSCSPTRCSNSLPCSVERRASSRRVRHALEQRRHARLELARAVVLRALEALDALHDARQAATRGCRARTAR